MASVGRPRAFGSDPPTGWVGLGGRYKFAHSPFYTFVALSLMVLYQLESLHLDDYNLIYS